MLSCRCPFMFSSRLLKSSTFCTSSVRFSLRLYIATSTTLLKCFLPATFSSCQSEEGFSSAKPPRQSANFPLTLKHFSKSWATRYSCSLPCQRAVADVLRTLQEAQFGEGQGKPFRLRQGLGRLQAAGLRPPRCSSAALSLVGADGKGTSPAAAPGPAGPGRSRPGAGLSPAALHLPAG